jgi:hypothetical protein
MKKAIFFCAAAAIVGAAWIVLNQFSGLQVIDDKSFQKEVYGSDRTVLILVTGAGCEKCDETEALLAKHAGGHPELKIVKMVSNENMPGPTLMMVVPAYGDVTYRKAHFHISEDTVDAFLTKRAEIGAQEKEAALKVIQLQDQEKSAEQPFIARQHAVDAQAAAATKAVDDQIADLTNKAAAARKPFDDQVAVLQAKIDAIRQPEYREVARLQAQGEAAANDYDKILEGLEKAEPATETAMSAEIDRVQLQADTDSVYADLSRQYDAAVHSGDQATAQVLQNKIQQRLRFWDDKLTAVRKAFTNHQIGYMAQVSKMKTEAAEARKPFLDQIDALTTDADKRATPMEKARNELKDKASAASEPFEDQIWPLKIEKTRLLQPFKDQTRQIDDEKDKVVIPLFNQIVDARHAIYDIIAADPSDLRK